MKLAPAREAKLLIWIFAIVILVVFAGAIFYKFGNNSTPFQPELVSDESSTTQAPEAHLAFVPTDTSQEYQLVVQDLTAPATSIAFQLTSSVSTPVISGTNIILEETLQQSGWTAIINSVENSDVQQSLSFSLVRTSLGERTAEPSIIVGTVRFANGANPDSITLNPEESFVTYDTSEEPTKLTLDSANTIEGQ